MNKNFRQAAKASEGYVIPEECAENEKAVKELALVTREEHYNSINLLVMSVLLIFTAVTFIAVNGGDSVDDNSMTLNFKMFMSGAYTQSLEDKYNNQLPVPETLKAVEERISLLYGIGNKVSDPIREIDSSTNSDRNSFDEVPDDKPDADENVLTVTTVLTDKEGETVTTSEEEKADGKGTTALPRPDATTSTATTTTENTTTNNDAPYVTTTVTEPVPDTTTTTEAPPVTDPPDTSTTTTTTSTSTEPEPPDITSSEESE